LRFFYAVTLGRKEAIENTHSSLKYLTPAAYAATFTARTIGCATPTSSADRPLLNPRRKAYKTPRL
jgi:hypothetical protein